MSNCKNCNTITVDKFCPACGQPAAVKRIDNHYISHELLHLLHFEKGILFTAKQLLLKPGHSIREYIRENRNKLMKPIPFLVVISLVTTFINYCFHFIDESAVHEHPVAEKTTQEAISHWVETHYGYANIMMGGIIALWIKLFFRKSGYNIYEITVLLCFVMGEGMILFWAEGIVRGITHNPMVSIAFVIPAWLYITWAIGQFFGEKKVINYVKAFGAYTLGFLTFQYGAVVIGLTYDYFHK